jgi:hypothetical protein
MITNADISAIAEQAAALVEKGWCQNRGFKHDILGQIEAVCLGYALNMASSAVLGERAQEASIDQVWYAFMARIAERSDGKHCYIPAWNDANGRTKQEVVDLALEVAKDYRIKADAEGAS